MSWFARTVLGIRTVEEEAFETAALRAVGGFYDDITPDWIAAKRKWLSSIDDPKWRRACKSWVDYRERRMHEKARDREIEKRRQEILREHR